MRGVSWVRVYYTSLCWFMSTSLWVIVAIAWDLQAVACFYRWTGCGCVVILARTELISYHWYWFISGVSVSVKGRTVLVLDTRLALNPKPHNAKGVSCPAGAQTPPSGHRLVEGLVLRFGWNN